MSKTKIVVIGGGTSSAAILAGLKREASFDLTAILPVTDSGGSSKAFIEAFAKYRKTNGTQVAMVPPGDVSSALLALSDHTAELKELLNYRFANLGSIFHGHSVRNLLVGAAMELWGVEGLDRLSAIFNVHARALPIASEAVRLYATLQDGTQVHSYGVPNPRNPAETIVLEGEEAVDYLPYQHGISSAITSIGLLPYGDTLPSITSAAHQAIVEADVLLFSPGDIWTSTAPILAIPGVKEALREAQGTKCYFVPLMTKRLNTDGFAVKDFVTALEAYAFPGLFDIVFYHRNGIAEDTLHRYAEEGAAPVALGDTKGLKAKVIIADLLYHAVIQPEKAETAAPRSTLRHDPEKVLNAVRELIKELP